ncbi:hypothetical protein GMORB2_0316 [Geosmithia morbida]|uniref:rRNA-processing protein FYV7 n=1 Tax=Geosmithia morbida TaxID=1094350 RepID=A0A9P4Z2M4_9HYPO|nr:uncharacterized protein GMORB2_0316 [Geosmithia morbida]KAF4126580.1 hypothetical protein GMORB2_0316 [Geosmithia morbida]
MAPRRPPGGSSPAPESKKPRKGFRVGPDNLPDGPWRRKVTKIKKDLIHKAKVKKQYAKIKAQEQPQQLQEKRPDGDKHDDGQAAADPALHPTRQLMLKDEEAAQTGVSRGGGHDDGDDDDGEAPGRRGGRSGGHSDGQRRRTRRPGYYDKQLQKADQHRAEAEARAREIQRRREEREQKMAQRDRYRRAMAKTVGPDGKKKLGRESNILLEKVKRIVGEQ